MNDDPKNIVQAGYDAIAGAYADWANRIVDPARGYWMSFLLETLPAGSAILDLGCGNGLPSTRELAARFAVTGVDISAQQIMAARRNVPEAVFVQSEMLELEFPPASFAAITAFYSIIHVPREDHPPLLQKIASWLKPGGYLVTVMGANDAPGDVDPDWLGAPMYWSHYPGETNLTMITVAGLEIVHSSEETISEDGVPVTFLWVVARAP